MHTRQDIWSLENAQPWHPVTLAYANAIDALQQRPDDDPTSWDYQAAVHGRTSTQA